MRRSTYFFKGGGPRDNFVFKGEGEAYFSGILQLEFQEMGPNKQHGGEGGWL